MTVGSEAIGWEGCVICTSHWLDWLRRSSTKRPCNVMSGTLIPSQQNSTGCCIEVFEASCVAVDCDVWVAAQLTSWSLVLFGTATPPRCLSDYLASRPPTTDKTAGNTNENASVAAANSSLAAEPASTNTSQYICVFLSVFVVGYVLYHLSPATLLASLLHLS